MQTGNLSWLIYALLAALCASMINILGKVGMKDVNPDLATAIRSVVQAVFVVSFCAIGGVWKHAQPLGGNARAYLSILLAGVAGGLSWIFVFRAIALADVTRVAPIDKLSLPIGIVLAVLVLGERPSPTNWIGIAMVAIGAYLAAQHA